MTNDRFYQRLSEKLTDLPDDPAFDVEGAWMRIQSPRRRAAGAWLWSMGLAASVLLAVGVWFFRNQFEPKRNALATLESPSLRVAPPVAAVPRRETAPRESKAFKPLSRAVAQLTATPEATPAPAPETVPVLPNPEPIALPVEVAAEPAPQPEAPETPGTVVLMIPVPGEDAQPVRKPFVARLFRQWKRYNRGETVDWNDLGLKPLKLAKARADSTRTSN